MLRLDELSVGEEARVLHFVGGGVENRLFALGIRQGIVIKRVTGPSRRGPIVILAGRTQVALGRGMAAKVIVERL